MAPTGSKHGEYSPLQPDHLRAQHLGRHSWFPCQQRSDLGLRKLAVLTACYLIYTIAIIAVPSLRRTMLQRNAKTGYSNKDDRLDLLMRKADLGDWFLIFLLSKNLDSILFREFISQLTEKLKTEP